MRHLAHWEIVKLLTLAGKVVAAAVSTFDIGSTGLIVGTVGHLNVLTTTLFLDAVAVTA